MISDDRLPAMEQIENLVKIFECVEVDFFTFLSKFRMKGEKIMGAEKFSIMG